MVFPPRWNGNTLFATGAFTAAVGLVLHAASARGFSDKCRVVDSPEDLLPSRLQDLGIGNIAEATFLDEIDLLCRPTVVLPGAGRALVPVVAAGAIAQIGAGGAFRGYKLGYEDAFFTGRRRSAVMRMGVGGTLMTIGAILWAASRGALYQNNTGCTDIDCVVWFDFGTFQASSILFMAGTGLVTEGMALKRSRQLYDDWKSFDVRPMLSGRRVGVAVSGRF